MPYVGRMKRKRTDRFLRDGRGNIAVLAALTAPVMVGAASLGVETGYWFYERERAQQAADLAANAGVVVLRSGGQAAAVSATARGEAGRHGFAAPDATVTVNAPPSSGPHVHGRAVEVTITFPLPRYFSAIFSDAPVIGEARAVAVFENAADACLLALDIAAPGAMTFSGSADISLLDCEVMSNSIASDAVLLAGSSDLETDCVNAVGGVQIAGGGSDLMLTGCAAPRVDLPRAVDPYAGTPMPDISQPCTSLPSGGKKGERVTVSPGAGGVGRFCGGLALNDGFEFEPGVYIVDGGTFRINANADILGSGVTFVMTGGAEARFNGSATIDITAPTTGPYAGIAFMGDPADSGAEHRFNGNASSRITGAIYTPSSSLDFLGNFSGAGGCMQLVASRVNLSGSVSIATNCAGTGIQWAQVPGRVRLVE